MNYEITTKEIYTQSEESIKRFYNYIELDKEIDILNSDIIINSISYSIKHNSVMIAGEPVIIRISKTGNMYFMLKKTYIKGILRNKLMEIVVKNQLEEIEELIELPKYIVKLMKSKFSGKEYVVWLTKNKIPVMATIKEKGIKRLEEQIKKIEYRVLKEELKYVHKINNETVFFDEKDEIYWDKPEDFINKEAELNELLQIVLDIRGSGRKLFPEEIELMKEINSEISNLIGE